MGGFIKMTQTMYFLIKQNIENNFQISPIKETEVQLHHSFTQKDIFKVKADGKFLSYKLANLCKSCKHL